MPKKLRDFFESIPTVRDKIARLPMVKMVARDRNERLRKAKRTCSKF